MGDFNLMEMSHNCGGFRFSFSPIERYARSGGMQVGLTCDNDDDHHYELRYDDIESLLKILEMAKEAWKKYYCKHSGEIMPQWEKS